MKKLIMTALTVAGLAYGVHAASVVWSVEGSLNDWNGDAMSASSGVTAYLYALAGESSAITYSNGALSFGTAQLIESIAASSFDDGWANWDGIDSSVSNLGNDPQYFQIVLSDADSLSSLKNGDHVYVYAASGNADVQYSANPFTPTLIEGYQFFEASGASAGNWQTVPEPTSGLLLLLGMAGLALKRKRA